MAKFIWFGTDYLFDGLTFVHERNLHGVFAVHGYPISANTSTFIVETDEQSWRRAGLDEFDVTQPPGASDMLSKVYLEKLFADQIDGHQLLVNNSRWANFRTLRTRRWHAMASRPVALLGDAVHTAHFSVGSGTKMAMEDAVALSQALASHPGDLESALAAYQLAAQPAVQKIQDAARPSLAWWEHFGRYYDAFEPWQFAYHFLSRSITDARLARRAPDLVEASHRAWIDSHGSQPLQTPFAHASWNSAGRIVEIRCGPDTTPAAITTGPGAGTPPGRCRPPRPERGAPGFQARLSWRRGFPPSTASWPTWPSRGPRLLPSTAGRPLPARWYARRHECMPACPPFLSTTRSTPTWLSPRCCRAGPILSVRPPGFCARGGCWREGPQSLVGRQRCDTRAAIRAARDRCGGRLPATPASLARHWPARCRASPSAAGIWRWSTGATRQCTAPWLPPWRLARSTLR